jgi:hypothetical protein
MSRGTPRSQELVVSLGQRHHSSDYKQMDRRRSKTQSHEDGRHRYPEIHSHQTTEKGESENTTLLIKVKAHRACPFNEESDIRTEMRHMKEERPGVNQPIEPSTNGQRPLRLRKGHSSPNKEHGLKQSSTG